MQFGDGEYTITYYKRISGNQYQMIDEYAINAGDTSDYMLYPNCYVPEVTPAWDYARLLCRDKNEMSAYQTIIKWSKHKLVYDYIKAYTVAKFGVMPDPHDCWEKKRGICQDIASLIVGMLRAAGVHARLVIGKANGRNHAWVEAVINGKVYRHDPCASTAKYVKERWY